MATYPPATTRQTRNGQTLTARVWELLGAAYDATPGITRANLYVTQGSFKAGSGAAASGSTHDGGGAFDLRTRDLPSSVRANLCQSLVTELRKRNVCAWYRDQAHGGMDPHIHGIVRDEASLSSGARQQVSDYDAGRNGLSNKGPDYHPRPAQRPFVYPPTPPTPPVPTPVPVPTLEDDPMYVHKRNGTGGDGVYLLAGGALVAITKASWDATPAAARVYGLVIPDAATWEHLVDAYGPPSA